MAQTYYILDKKGFQTQVPDVNSFTDVDTASYKNGTNYRDDPAGLLTVATVAVANYTTDVSIGTGMGGVGIYGGFGTALGAGTLSATPSVYASDLVTHTAPRNELFIRTERKFWAGKAHSQTLTTTSASASITAVSVEFLAVGQAVSGTGIVTGTTITAIAPLTGVITLSAAATATGSTSITFDGGRILATIWLDQIMRCSPNQFTRAI